jgi:trigger factor
MEITVEEISPLTRKLTIQLPAEDVARELDAAYTKLKSEVNLKGFRKGKVPRRILEQNYGPRVRAEVGEKLVQATYFDAIELQKLDVVAHPEIKTHSFGDDGTFVYEAEVDTRPQFELHQYKGLEIEKPAVVVDDAEVAVELERMRKEMAPLRTVTDRALALNDIAIVDFQGFHNSEPLPQIKGADASIDLGSGRNGKEFEEKLIGLRKGETTGFEIEYPAQAPNPVLAGKKVAFEVTVKEAKERVLTDLDDDFAKDVGEQFSTLDALKAHIAETLKENKEAALSGDITDKLMQALLAGHDFEVPARLIQYEINDYINQTEQRLKASGLTLESAGVNREEMASHYREVAEKRVRGDFILKKIADQENITLAEEDVQNGFGRIAAQYNMTVEEVKGYFKSRDDMLPFLNELLNEKILKMLQKEAVYKTIAAPEPEADSSEEQAPGDAS